MYGAHAEEHGGAFNEYAAYDRERTKEDEFEAHRRRGHRRKGLGTLDLTEQIQQEDFQSTIVRRDRAEQFEASQKAAQEALRSSLRQ
jgi:hypothetical protein